MIHQIKVRSTVYLYTFCTIWSIIILNDHGISSSRISSVRIVDPFLKYPQMKKSAQWDPVSGEASVQNHSCNNLIIRWKFSISFWRKPTYLTHVVLKKKISSIVPSWNNFQIHLWFSLIFRFTLKCEAEDCDTNCYSILLY